MEKMHGFTERCFISSCLFNFTSWFWMRFIPILLIPYNFILSILPRKQCPPIDDKILLYSATVLAEKIRQGEIKCEAVIKAYMSRIEAVNPLINGVIEDRFNHAIRESMAVDELIKDGKYTAEELKATQPLLGVPITIKESIAVKGMTHNAGSLKMLYERLRATEDAPVVRAVKEAGAIVIAVTSTPELCMDWETSNKIIGTANNPYNLRKTPGGSSGGEAALISSGASLIGLGSDIAGSLRIPAHFTGIFSHKPTPGIIPVKGHYPFSPDPRYSKYLVIGPLTRYAEDLPLLMDVIAQAENKSMGNILYKELLPIRDINIFYMLDNGGNYLTNKVDTKIRTAIQSAAKYFQNVYGIQPVQASVKLLKHSVKVANFPLINIKDIDNVCNGEGESPWKEFYKHITCRSKACLQTIILAMEMQYFKNSDLLKHKCEESEKILDVLKQEFKTLLGDNGVLLYPTLSCNAKYHSQLFSHMFDTSYCTIFNVLGFPATNCPIKMDSQGMPVGIQVVANPNNDRLTISVANELERAFGGWIPPGSNGEKITISTVQESTRI